MYGKRSVETSVLVGGFQWQMRTVIVPSFFLHRPGWPGLITCLLVEIWKGIPESVTKVGASS